MTKKSKRKVEKPANPLFTNGENYSLNACVGDNGRPHDLFDYGRGFFEGGHAIVKSVQEYAISPDIAVYPAAFSYRHAIELCLKHLVITLRGILGEGEKFEKNHSIVQQLRTIIVLNEAIEAPIIERVAVDRASELIVHFQTFDPSGQVFRYPEDIKGNRHLVGHKLINVKVLRDHMKELQEVLERWISQAEDRLEYQREYQLRQVGN